MRLLSKRPNILSLVLIKHDTDGIRLNPEMYEHPHLFLMDGLIQKTSRIVRLPYLLKKLEKIAKFIFTPDDPSIRINEILDRREKWHIWRNPLTNEPYHYDNCGYGTHSMGCTLYFLNGMLHRENGNAISYSRRQLGVPFIYGQCTDPEYPWNYPYHEY